MSNDTICHLRHFLTCAKSASALDVNKETWKTPMNLLVNIFSYQPVMHGTRVALFTSYAIHD